MKEKFFYVEIYCEVFEALKHLSLKSVAKIILQFCADYMSNDESDTWELSPEEEAILKMMKAFSDEIDKQRELYGN